MPADFERILVYRLGGLGDLTVALPVINALAARYPKARRALLTNLPISAKSIDNHELFDGTGLFQDYFHYERGTRSLGALWGIRSDLRRWRPDLICNLHPRTGFFDTLRDGVFFRALQPRALWAPPLRSGRSHRQIVGTDLWESEATRLGRFMSDYLDVDVENDAAWDLRLGTVDQPALAGKFAPTPGKRYVVFNLGGKSDTQNWGDDRWRQVLDGLSRRFPELGLVMVGAPLEHERCDMAGAGWQDERWNLCGSLSVRETALVLRGSLAYLGQDTGPLHLAEAVGVPAIAVFCAHNEPGIWFPRGRSNRIFYHRTPCFGCGLETCVAEGKKCILSITPDSVLGEAQDLLEALLQAPAG